MPMSFSNVRQRAWQAAGLVAIGVVATIAYMWQRTPAPAEMPVSALLQAANEHRVASVDLRGGNADVILKNGERAVAFAPAELGLVTFLSDRGVRVSMHAPEERSTWFEHLSTWAPAFLLAAAFFYFASRMQSPGKGGAFAYGKSRARLLDETNNSMTFADVAGCDEAKADVQEFVEYLKDPQKFQKLGGRIPRGVLMVGPPGTGKTLLAKAIAGEAKVPFFTISGSDFVEMFVGVGAARVRDLFEQAKKSAPCIVFVDEIDAVGRLRQESYGTANDEREQTLNQMLVEMDGFETNLGVVIMAATNRPDVLDPALLRPGRFDRKVRLSLPDARGRETILRVHARKVPVADSVDLALLARRTPSFSGADLANVVNDAALIAARENQRQVTMANFESAVEKIRTAMRRRLLLESDADKERVAVHELGHFIVSLHYEGISTIHSISLFNPHEFDAFGAEASQSNLIISRTAARNTLIAILGGRAAENVYFDNDDSNLAAGDLALANAIAHDMVMRWGMHDDDLSLNDDLIRDREIRQRPHASLLLAADSPGAPAIRALVAGAYDAARQCILDNQAQLREWVDQLVEAERLDASWVDKSRKRIGRKESRRQSTLPGSEGAVDFAIITAIDVERSAVCEAFGLTSENRKNLESRVYWRGRMDSIRGGGGYEIVVAQLADMANVNAALLCHDVLRHWSPQAILMVGIAGAANAKQSLGDVVVADAVWYYELGKDTPQGRSPAPTVFPVDATLLNRIRAVPEWTTPLPVRRPDGTNDRPKVGHGVIASGERVIANAALRDEIASVHRKMAAIEMEGYGVSNSVWASFRPTRHLVIRALCDRADSSKSDEWHAYAAVAAAQFTRHFLADRPLEPLRGRE